MTSRDSWSSPIKRANKRYSKVGANTQPLSLQDQLFTFPTGNVFYDEINIVNFFWIFNF